MSSNRYFEVKLLNAPVRRTGYSFEELMMWHDSGDVSTSAWTEPAPMYENPRTKRRLHSLLSVSGILERVTILKSRRATVDEIERFHSHRYVENVQAVSNNDNGGYVGEEAHIFRAGFEIALLSAGSVLAAVEDVLNDKIDNAYCLVRPPGHHALRDTGMGFCIFNNVVIAALHARSLNKGVKRIAVVDYDVHHGNGTQEAFWNDPDALLISLHQDNNYPPNSGSLNETGGEQARGSIINIPLPPGCGNGAYEYAFERVVEPALLRFRPDLILVSSGFDASYYDPLGRMMLSSEAFRQMARRIVNIAKQVCSGKVVFAHEGGYSESYVPYCGLAVIEELCGVRTSVIDPYLDEIHGAGGHRLESHQERVVNEAAERAGLPLSQLNFDI